ncbi:putative DnaJ domain containing protein [Leishmania utingensis]|uniref:DnaJ domain containing protein n=1 Tax=Leishmania utingensis TaxID=653362 RepID=A0AAW2ZWE5_9TRYP
MFRRALLCLGTPSDPSRLLSPHQVLGVAPGTPFEEVRQRFYELTKKYHPDVEHGDPIKFREINAAYRLLRAEYRQSSSGRSARDEERGPSSSGFRQAKKSETPTGGAFWAERNERVRKANEQRERERWAAEDRDRRQQGVKRSFFHELVAFLKGSEIAISIGTVVLVLLYSVERYHTINCMLTEKRRRLKNMDEGLPPSMPLEVDKALSEKYSALPDSREQQIDALRIREESYYRRATQRKFEDFREFMFVYDPEAVASRKVVSTRFSHQYMREAEISKRCPILREFNSESRTHHYGAIEKELEQAIREAPWSAPDAGYAGALVAKGLSCIAANSPSTTKWTFIEYTDMDKGSTKANTTCLAALRNLRFGQTGMCQRVIVTGKSELQPRLVAQRERDLMEGALQKRSLLTGGALPVKDLSVPLESMKL